ncbi:MAG TPA: hypothetical protein VFR58_02225, partial [Flavisolibacter sp.]|nr:hypothetical protein [Flavisolibacter sp.]
MALPLLTLFFTLQLAAQEIVTEDMPEQEEETEEVQTYFDSLRAEAPALELRQVPDSIMKAIRADEDYWYANMA